MSIRFIGKLTTPYTYNGGAHLIAFLSQLPANLVSWSILDPLNNLVLQWGTATASETIINDGTAGQTTVDMSHNTLNFPVFLQPVRFIIVTGWQIRSLATSRNFLAYEADSFEEAIQL